MDICSGHAKNGPNWMKIVPKKLPAPFLGGQKSTKRPFFAQKYFFSKNPFNTMHKPHFHPLLPIFIKFALQTWSEHIFVPSGAY